MHREYGGRGSYRTWDDLKAAAPLKTLAPTAAVKCALLQSMDPMLQASTVDGTSKDLKPPQLISAELQTACRKHRDRGGVAEHALLKTQ